MFPNLYYARKRLIKFHNKRIKRVYFFKFIENRDLNLNEFLQILKLSFDQEVKVIVHHHAENHIINQNKISEVNGVVVDFPNKPQSESGSETLTPSHLEKKFVQWRQDFMLLLLNQIK